MRIITAEDLAGVFTYPELIEALRAAFRRGAVLPVRHHHPMARPGEPAATLLLMPAWDTPAREGTRTGFVGVKVVTAYPGNAARGMPGVLGTYLLMCGDTGEPLAVIDGSALTHWRTAAASALAASYLAHPDAGLMLMVGAGSLAPHLIRAHASIRPIAEVLVWNRNGARAEAVAKGLAGEAFSVRATDDLESAARAADIISCATFSYEPLIRGAWLKRGAHLDLVGAYTPAMRESDNEAVRRARLYVDTREGALKEAGDLVLPFQAGIRRESDVVGDLFRLCRGEVPGRETPGEITLFKSVGTAIEDLAAATLAYQRLSPGEPPPAA